jgi:coenzyme F420-reducing hydrogenase delta subunit/quinol-cytochrome oxidoreductase complex cytochrome b subunit
MKETDNGVVSGSGEVLREDRGASPSRGFGPAGPLQRLWLKMESLVNALTTPALNPFYYLGAICVFFLWIILVSGIYLFLFYSISAKGAYLSIQNLTINQWYLGGVMRSLHRYASDGLVIFMLLHALRCFTLDRYKHWRWLAWVSGIVIAWVVLIGGIFGYWMVWDEKARLVATLSAHLLENVPIFGLPMSLNFSRAANLTDQLFYIVLFIHFSTIFFLFIAILVHIVRITKAVINPPKALAWGIMVMLLALSFIKPAMSTSSAELKWLADPVQFDWFFMFIFPLLKYMSAYMLWAFIAGLTLMAALIPWMTRSTRKPPVEITLSNCTGCELCAEDCPYQAIQMRKRTDGMPYPLEALIIPKRCASCGICVGSCDYKALNLPDITEDGVKASVRRHAKELNEAAHAGPKIIVFACAKGAWLDGADGKIPGFESARVVNLPCIGMLQPSMLSIPFERSAAIDGVFVASCRQGDCHYRRGEEWFMGRLAGHRPPVVRKAVDRARLKVVHLSAAEQKEFLEELASFGASLGERRQK